MAGFSSGDVLTAANLNDGLGLRETVYFTSSGTFTKASYPWLRAVRVTVVGAGGGGGGTYNDSGSIRSLGGGGAGGGTAIKFIELADLGASETVTIGSGGAGGGGGTSGTNGNTGGTSSFGSHCSATGGGGGSAVIKNPNANFAEGSAPGVGSNGDLNYSGTTGGIGGWSSQYNFFGSMTGGASSVSGTVYGTHGLNVNTTGANGLSYGGGATGGYGALSSAGAAGGGDGANGIVIMELYA